LSISTKVWIAFVAVLALAAIVVTVDQSPQESPPEPAAEPPFAPAAETGTGTKVYGYDILREFPHDPQAFTQGLIYHDGFLYESTGLTGQSSLRKVRLETGEVIQQHRVDRRYFAEGLTEWRGSLVQLAPMRGNWTVRSAVDEIRDFSSLVGEARRRMGYNAAFTYDLTSFELQSTLSYKGEAWGLTHDGHRLIMSDGSSRLRFLAPDNFNELGNLEVTDQERPVAYLNELEFVDGKVYANVWLQDRIAIILPDSGEVTGWIDLEGLKSRMPVPLKDPARAVLNGIAHDADGGRLFVTGKLWPKLFEIRLR
jgi:glutamine cyclotransferase